MITQISVAREQRSLGYAPLALGFRPFFLVAGVAALLLIGVWLAVYRGALGLPVYYDAITWHGHEMVFGYTVAVIAGFLLTAVRNWTNVPTATGTALALLVLLWLAGRIAPLLPAVVPRWLIAAIDLAFLPALAVALSTPLLRAPQARQLVFLPLLIALAVMNLLVHLQMLGATLATARTGLYVAVDVVMIVITVIGGRVIPFFTQRGAGTTPRTWVAVEWLVAAATVGVAIADLAGAPPAIFAAIALLAAGAHAVRLAGWYDARIWGVPLLWVLHLGYAWLVAGFALRALAALGLVIPWVGLHALTVGAIGVLTLGMMTRVTLGHTGRLLRASRPMAVAFALINAAAVVRALVPAALPASYAGTVLVAGVLWVAAFAIFVVVHAPMLVQARVDGAPG